MAAAVSARTRERFQVAAAVATRAIVGAARALRLQLARMDAGTAVHRLPPEQVAPRAL